MSRLVTFGCSTTQGEGLENPKEETWGAYLSKYLNIPHINKGIAGASNKLISHEVTTFQYEPNDVVLILWANPNRYSIMNSKTEYCNILPRYNDSESILYYKYFYKDFDQIFINKVFTSYAINFLKKNNINFYQLLYNKELIEYVDDIQNIIPIYLGYYFKTYSLAPDNLHLGKEGNNQYADKIYKYITKTSVI